LASKVSGKGKIGEMRKLDVSDRIEIEELLARYCHRVDHDDAEGWAALFTPDGSFEVLGAMRLQGTEQLRTMPGIVSTQGSGKWRHQITSIATEVGAEPGTARLQAYGLVTDWRDGNKLMAFTDYDMNLSRVDGTWRIKTLVATGVP
jgi:uncharacterized protein (TIGR02246 family)